MASERDNMMGIANSYIKGVNGAKGNCEDAVAQIRLVISQVEQSWDSQSGTAMVQKLESIITSINTTSERIAGTAGAMQKEAK